MTAKLAMQKPFILTYKNVMIENLGWDIRSLERGECQNYPLLHHQYTTYSNFNVLIPHFCFYIPFFLCDFAPWRET
jgi:hypothetical protein